MVLFCLVDFWTRFFIITQDQAMVQNEREEGVFCLGYASQERSLSKLYQLIKGKSLMET